MSNDIKLRKGEQQCVKKMEVDINGKNIKLEIVELKNWKFNKENQKVFPYFVGEGTETVKAGVPTYRRYSVIAIIKNCKENKYLCVDSKKHLCKSFVMGGIETNETPEEAAVREIKEETGYVDVEIDYISPVKIINHFYAGYKGDFNRLSTLYIVYGRLNSEDNIGISESENKKHTVKWIDESELMKFLSLEHNKYALKLMLDKNATFTGKGIKFEE